MMSAQKIPKIHASAFVASSAVIIGDVIIKKDCSVFPHAVIRGDQNTITIDEGANVQDCCVIHVDQSHTVSIGKSVSLGHSSMIHGACIEDECLIGIHATVLNGVRIGTGSIIGANALVTADMQVPAHSLVLGVPGKIIKQDESFVDSIRTNAEIYQNIARNHKQGLYQTYQPDK